MWAPVTLPLGGTARTVALTNVRQGSPLRTAPILRKMASGTTFPFLGVAVGEAVQGNAQWYSIDGGGFVWAGATEIVSTAAASSAASDAVAPSPASEPTVNPSFKNYGLDPIFAAKLTELFKQCAETGLEFRISQGLRTPDVQARYYCITRSRTAAQIDASIRKLRTATADWLADVLQQYRNLPQGTRWLTNALPGAGWHQWGEAADCYCYRNGVMVDSGDDPCYKTYADLAKQIGLTPGYYFNTRDAGHVQLRPDGGASDVYSWSEIDREMQKRFGEKPDIG